MNIRDAIANRLRKVVDALAEGRVEPWMILEARACAPSLRHQVSVRKTPIASVAHVEARQATEAVDAIHARKAVRKACADRAGGCCESCGTRRGEALHMDHFWGRAREESVESCWMLCARCDREKTENVGGRVEWLRRFGAHAALHGYREQETKVDAALALERAQHREIAR